MTRCYWDTSAVVKLYVPEPDSAYFLGLIGTTDLPVLCSAVAEAEMLCAFYRKEREGDLKSGAAAVLHRRFQSDCEAGRILLVPYGGDVVAEAGRLAKIAFAGRKPVMIRSLDLIHMATASVMNAATVVATDRKIRDFAALLKLQILP